MEVISGWKKSAKIECRRRLRSASLDAKFPVDVAKVAIRPEKWDLVFFRPFGSLRFCDMYVRPLFKVTFRGNQSCGYKRIDDWEQYEKDLHERIKDNQIV